MRSAIIAAAFAAGAIAVPYQKRAIVTDYDITYVTDVVTVTAGQPEATSTSTSSSSTVSPVHFGHHNHQPSVVEMLSIAQPSVSVSSYSYLVLPTEAPALPSSEVWSTSWSQAWTYPAASSSAPPAASSSAPASSYSPVGANDYQNKVLVQHNAHRANHSAPAMSWDSDLEDTARQVAETCDYKHQMNFGSGNYGQNIASGLTADKVDVVITDMFYNGEVNNFNGLYGQAQPDMSGFDGWGHFSQIVWKASTSVGCYTQDCTNHEGGLQNAPGIPPFFTVCNYGAPGNFGNEYADNIGEPLGHATITIAGGPGSVTYSK